MKRMRGRWKLARSLVVACFLAGTHFAIAADKSIKGEGKCTREHQTTVEVKEGDKTVTYYLAENEVSKKFHSKICSKSAQVRVVGEVEEVEGRKQMTAKRIMLLNSEASK